MPCARLMGISERGMHAWLLLFSRVLLVQVDAMAGQEGDRCGRRPAPAALRAHEHTQRLGWGRKKHAGWVSPPAWGARVGWALHAGQQLG